MNNKKPVWLKGIFAAVLIAILCVGWIITLGVLESQKEDGNMVEIWEDIVLGILSSVAASVIFAILTRIYSRNDADAVDKRLKDIEAHLARQNELYDSGIKSIRPKAHFDQEDDYWNNIINGSSSRLDLIGHSLRKWFGIRYRETFIRKILQIVSSGGCVNVVLSTSSTDNIWVILSNVRAAYQHKEIKLNKIEKTLLEFYRLLKDTIPAKNRQRLRVYVTNLEQVTYFYIRTDEQCIISPYTYSLGDRENIFLLELRPNTDHVKILEDDFEEMISNLTPIDFRIDEIESREKGIWFEKHYSIENSYKSREWNREATNKFIFRDSHGIYETGLFLHYEDQKFVKSVIELPVGFGCPSKCHYCATFNIDGFYPLEPQQMKYMFDYLYKNNDLQKMGMVLLSLTGMGDIYFKQNNVFSFLDTLRDYENINLTLSSNYWTKSLLEKAVAVDEYLPIRYIQYTYVSDRQDIRKSLIDIYGSIGEKDFLSEFISFIQASNKSFYRINYIVIKGINDSREDVDRFIDLVAKITDKVTIRLSQLNETGATKKNHLAPVNLERLGEINERLINAGLQSYVFYAEKNDNMNCGQLITESGHLQ